MMELLAHDMGHATRRPDMPNLFHNSILHSQAGEAAWVDYGLPPASAFTNRYENSTPA
jgi:hypothetical protein